MLVVEGGMVVNVRLGVAEAGDWAILDSGRLAKPEEVPLTGDCERLDATGCYIVPGLIDAHVHLGRPRAQHGWVADAHVARVLKETLRAGITTVRDLGDRWTTGLAVVEAARDQRWPRVISALSGITVPNGYGGFLGEAVRNGDELRKAVQLRHQAGAKVIKLYLTGGVDFATGQAGPRHFEAGAVKLAAEAAHANGGEAVRVAVQAGADTIEHGILVDEDAVSAMASREVYWVPTLIPLRRVLSSTNHEIHSSTSTLAMVFERHRESVAKAFQIGVKIVAGSDAGSPGVPHGCILDEIEQFVGCGVSAAAAVKSATITAAQALGIGSEAGLIEEGRFADLLVVPGDPLKEVAVLKRATHVIHAGKISAFAQNDSLTYS